MIHQQTFQALREHYRKGTLSPVEVAASAMDHAERVQGALNAFALLDRARALSAAAQSEQRWRAGVACGPLDGMPVTIKEFAAVQGWPTRRGSAVTSAAPAAASTVFVERLLAGGATPLGKTRAPEFNWKGVTDSPAYGITRNPWDTALTPGGSSGGCSAAVAAGVVRVSLGSDAGGSVRIPAAFTGTIGLKPSFGRIPAQPLPSAFSQIVHTGPIAISMQDLAEVMQVCGGASTRDWTSALGAAPDYVSSLADRSQSLRVGVLKPARWAQSCREVKQAMQHALENLRGAGMQVVEVDFDVTQASSVSAAFYRIGCGAAIRTVPEPERVQLDPGLLDFADGADGMPLVDYLAACHQRDQFNNQLADVFERVDLLMLPTVPILPFEAGALTPRDWPSRDWMSWNPFTPAFNLAQVPALSYPFWPAGSARPVGIQFVAPRLCEARLMAIGAWLETVQPVRLSPMAAAR